MPYVVPPMDDEPPPDFVTFVSARLADVQREAARLTGGVRYAEEIYPLALSDVAIHWRRLKFRHRLEHRDTAGEFLRRRLARRARQWREDQVYEVEVLIEKQAVADGMRVAAQAGSSRRTSVAQLKAAILPATVRLQFRPVAEASIAWEHAYRRYRWHAIARVATAMTVGAMFLGRFLESLSSYG